MQTLELGPAELWICAPDVPAVGEAILVERMYDNEMKRFWVRAAPAFLGKKKDIFAYNFFYQEESERGLSAVMEGQSYLYLTGDQSEDEQRWLKYINWEYGWGLWRACLPATDPLLHVKMGTTSGVVFLRDCFAKGPGSIFRFDSGRDYTQFSWWPQRDLEALLAAHFEDENSQLRRAYAWQKRSEQQRTDHVFRCENGNARELLTLIRCVASNIRFERAEVFYCANTKILHGHSFDPADRTALDVWMEKIVEVMRPAYLRADFLDFEETHLEEVWESIFDYPLGAEPTPLNAHEQLETYLHLRDWALEYAPSQAQHLLELLGLPAA